jgi:hypothetical protein
MAGLLSAILPMHIDLVEKRTSGTAGTANEGEPLATLPKPACEPHMVSENSSSSKSVCVFFSLLKALVVENCSAREFMMMCALYTVPNPND